MCCDDEDDDAALRCCVVTATIHTTLATLRHRRRDDDDDDHRCAREPLRVEFVALGEIAQMLWQPRVTGFVMVAVSDANANVCGRAACPC